MKFLIIMLYCNEGEQTINSFAKLLEDIDPKNIAKEIAKKLQECLLAITGDDAGITLISHSLIKI